MATKKQRLTEYKKIQDELKLMAGQPEGWTKIDKKLSELKEGKLTGNDIKSLKQWIAKEKEERKKMLKTELEQINDFFQQYKEHPKALKQMGLYQKGLSQSAPMYDTLIESNEIELNEIDIVLKHGFNPINASTFGWQTDPEWQAIQVKKHEKKKDALKKQLEDVKKSLAEVEEEVEKQKGEKDKRIAQIKEELKELGEAFPKDELSYIG